LFEINVELSDVDAYLFSETAIDFNTMKITVDRVEYGEAYRVSSDIAATTINVALTLTSSPPLLGRSVNVTCQKQNVERLKFKYFFFEIGLGSLNIFYILIQEVTCNRIFLK